MRWGWLLLAGGLVGCEQMPDPGGVGAMFEPVAVKTTSTAATDTVSPHTTPITTPPADDPFAMPEPVTVTSLPPEPQPTPTIPPTTATAPASTGVVDGGASGAVPTAVPAAGTGGGSSTGVVGGEVVTAPPVPVSMPTSGMFVGGGLGGSGGWPLRLIKTLPDTQPPRAILGLPSGEEIVISPGKMLPEQGLVVMSVGPKSVDLAYISPAGDHAAVRSISLNTQY